MCLYLVGQGWTNTTGHPSAWPSHRSGLRILRTRLPVAREDIGGFSARRYRRGALLLQETAQGRRINSSLMYVVDLNMSVIRPINDFSRCLRKSSHGKRFACLDCIEVIHKADVQQQRWPMIPIERDILERPYHCFDWSGNDESLTRAPTRAHK